MKLAIVGHEGAKFTREGEINAREMIRALLAPRGTILVSGHCHLGGIDIWAEEEATALRREMEIYPPALLRWTGARGAPGFKERNLQIAHACDGLICIVVNRYPPSYQGMRFDYCYHCKTSEHIKSGGCWTGRRAEMLGKSFQVRVVNQ